MRSVLDTHRQLLEKYTDIEPPLGYDVSDDYIQLDHGDIKETTGTKELYFITFTQMGNLQAKPYTCKAMLHMHSCEKASDIRVITPEHNYSITNYEIELVWHLAQGDSIKMVKEMKESQESTLYTVLHNIREKLECHNTNQLISYFEKLGLITCRPHLSKRRARSYSHPGKNFHSKRSSSKAHSADATSIEDVTHHTWYVVTLGRSMESIIS